jgi:hypothetical protein
MFARPSFRHIPLRAPLAILKHSISSKATIARKPIYLNLVVPPSLKPELLKFESTSHFVDFVKSYRGRGSLKYPSSENPGQYDIISPRKSSTFSPSITYELLAPGWGRYQGEYRHTQVSDKAFEDKSRLASHRKHGEAGIEVQRT